MPHGRWLGLALAVALAATLTGCPSGWRLVRVEGERPTVHPDLWREIHAIATGIQEEASQPGSACSTYGRPLVHCASGKPELCRRTPATTTIAVPSEDRLTSLWSFVHMSDVQLKEHRVTMEGALSTAAYDGLTNGALRDPLLERHDDAVLLATVMAINAFESTDWLSGAFGDHPPAPPRFVLHTGDAVDVGLFSELTQFLAAMNELKLPLYNALGNHDSLFFGAFPFEHMEGTNVLLPYVPIYDTDRFMRFHSPDGAAADISVPFLEPRTPHTPTQLGMAYAKKPKTPDELKAFQAAKGRDGPQSNFHGFDLTCYRGLVGGTEGGGLCPEVRGYYSFDVGLPGRSGCTRKLRFVILNTSEVVPETINQGFSRLAKGNIQPEQLRWLSHELTRGDEGGAEVYSLVVGHHQLSGFLHDDQEDRLRTILMTSPRVLAYLSGHTHQDASTAHRRLDGSTLWELTAGSTLVFPQLSRLIELLEGPDDRLWLRVATFRQQLSDHVDDLPVDSRCAQLARRAKLGRDGARRDNDQDREDEAVAIERANGIFPVWQQEPKTCPTNP